MKEIKAKSWVLRGKDTSGSKFENNVPAFEAGAIIDLDSLKLGWEREGIDRPERRWNPSLSQAMPRPSDEKKPSGGYVWTNALSVRVALGKGETATWEQGQWAAYEGFRRLAVNACYWAQGMEDKIPARSNVDFVGQYNPNKIGMGKHQTGLKPSDHELK